jgi:hypothetical protein
MDELWAGTVVKDGHAAVATVVTAELTGAMLLHPSAGMYPNNGAATVIDFSGAFSMH